MSEEKDDLEQKRDHKTTTEIISPTSFSNTKIEPPINDKDPIIHLPCSEIDVTHSIDTEFNKIIKKFSKKSNEHEQ